MMTVSRKSAGIAPPGRPGCGGKHAGPPVEGAERKPADGPMKPLGGTRSCGDSATCAAAHYQSGPRRYKLRQMAEPPTKYPLLETIDIPADLRRLPQPKLAQLAAELREFLIHSVSTRGGHFAAGLGTVELTIA